jgi:hypothetical protein
MLQNKKKEKKGKEKQKEAAEALQRVGYQRDFYTTH